VKAVVVTGASSGIGADAAAQLAAAGFVVFAGVRDDAAAAALAALGDRVRPLHLDVTDPEQIASAAAAVGAAGFPLAALVNNAGIAVGGPLEALPLDQVRRVFEVNVFGALAVTQAFLPQLRAARGRLVFVGSIAGRLAIPFIAPYSASKFALRAFTDALRVELAPDGIEVTLIEPGSVRTPIWAKGRASRERLLAQLPPAAVEHYRARLESMFTNTAREERNALPVEVVGRSIVRAVTARRPRTNDLIGFPARAGSIVALLPGRVRQKMFRG